MLNNHIHNWIPAVLNTKTENNEIPEITVMYCLIVHQQKSINVDHKFL